MFSSVVDELAGLSDAELTARIEANELQRRRLDAEMSAALAVADSRNLHGVTNHRTMTGFCRAKLNWSTTESVRRLALGRAATGLPGMGDAWVQGHIGLPQALKLSTAHGNERITERLDEFAPQLLEHAEKMPYRDFSIVVDHVVKRLDEDGSHDDRDAATEGRSARVVDVGGLLDVRAHGGDGITTDEMIDIHRRFAEAEYRKDVEARRDAHGDDADGFALARTEAQRRFDALVHIFRAASAAAEAGIVGTPAATVVNIVIDAATWGRMLLASGLGTATDLDGTSLDPFTGLPVTALDGLLDDLTDPTQRCATRNGVELHPHDVLRSALAGHIRRVVVDSDHVIIDQGRKQRLFTGSARDAAKLLIKHCEHVGCELPVDWCDVDHVAEWHRDRGATDQRNAAVLCRYHNNSKHRMRWRTRRATNGCSYTIDADGRILLPVGARPPGFDDSHPSDPGGSDHPDTVARLTVLARNRLEALCTPTGDAH